MFFTMWCSVLNYRFTSISIILCEGYLQVWIAAHQYLVTGQRLFTLFFLLSLAPLPGIVSPFSAYYKEVIHINHHIEVLRQGLCDSLEGINRVVYTKTKAVVSKQSLVCVYCCVHFGVFMEE